MSQYPALPSYNLLSAAAKPRPPSVKVISPTDGVKLQIAEIYRIQSLKMPDYSRFASNILSLPANDYSFGLEQTVLNKYMAEERAAAPTKMQEPKALQPKIEPKKESEQPMPTITAGGMLRPSAANSTPRLDPTPAASGSSRNPTEWAAFEPSPDLFDDMLLKSMDDRHELARVLVPLHVQSQPNTPSQMNEANQAPVTHGTAISGLMEEHKKLSLSDNNLSRPSQPPSGSLHPSDPLPPPRGLKRSSPNPPVFLSPGQLVAVEQTVAMGFDRQLCSRFAHDLDTDNEEILANTVLAYSSLIAAGFNEKLVERALTCVNGDERKARSLLEASKYLEQFGFSHDKIFAAVASLVGDKKHQSSSTTSSCFSSGDELRDKLLDMLTTNGDF